MATARGETKSGSITTAPIKHGKEEGWVRVMIVGLPFPVELRLVERQGRTYITALHLELDEGIDASMLRQIPLGLIEAQANVPETTTWREAAPKARVYGAKRAATKIKIPDKKPFPDEFYQSVASAYHLCVAAGLSPGPTLAEAKGVPLTQVHGWVRIARAKGLLATGSIGKAG
jgi:hypothetical protein